MALLGREGLNILLWQPYDSVSSSVTELASAVWVASCEEIGDRITAIPKYVEKFNFRRFDGCDHTHRSSVSSGSKSADTTRHAVMNGCGMNLDCLPTAPASSMY